MIRQIGTGHVVDIEYVRQDEGSKILVRINGRLISSLKRVSMDITSDGAEIVTIEQFPTDKDKTRSASVVLLNGIMISAYGDIIYPDGSVAI